MNRQQKQTLAVSLSVILSLLVAIVLCYAMFKPRMKPAILPENISLVSSDSLTSEQMGWIAQDKYLNLLGEVEHKSNSAFTGSVQPASGDSVTIRFSANSSNIVFGGTNKYKVWNESILNSPISATATSFTALQMEQNGVSYIFIPYELITNLMRRLQ